MLLQRETIHHACLCFRQQVKNLLCIVLVHRICSEHVLHINMSMNKWVTTIWFYVYKKSYVKHARPVLQKPTLPNVLSMSSCSNTTSLYLHETTHQWSSLFDLNDLNLTYTLCFRYCHHLCKQHAKIWLRWLNSGAYWLYINHEACTLNQTWR